MSKCLEGGGLLRERGVNKGVLIGTMGRFLSGNVSDSFRRVQYLFRLYSLPHRAGGMKKPLARDEGAVLAGGKQTSGDTHTHSPISKPCYCCCRSSSAAELLLGKKSCQSLSVHVDLVFATHFAADCACGAGGGSFCGDYFGSNGFSPMPTSTKYSKPTSTKYF